MQDIVHFLFWRTWWVYDPGSDWYAQPYHWINLVEGVAWLIFATLVLRRYRQHRHSWLEVVYGLLFVTFGLTDFREAYVVQSWLILLKGVNLIALLYLRWFILKRYYPQNKTF